MTEYVYRLNLPPFETVAKEEFLANVESRKSAKYQYFEADQILKMEFLSVCNINFTKAILFVKNKNIKGVIHTDVCGSNEIVWAINWIFKNPGTMEYWDEKSLPAPTTRITPTEPFNIYKFWDKNKVPAQKKYIMHPGAYLVHAAVPHCADADNDRYCLSLRSTMFRDATWEHVVNLFDSIIDKSY